VGAPLPLLFDKVPEINADFCGEFVKYLIERVYEAKYLLGGVRVKVGTMRGSFASLKDDGEEQATATTHAAVA
jgi:hypothetical protein